ncbi:MAG: aldose epimerase family protein [Chthoniobacteraceae bacterium]|jgi:aldose 1-epimerase
MSTNRAHAAQPVTVTSKPFGKSLDGQRIHLYTLTAPSGMRVEIATYGATIIKLLAPDRAGRLADVTLGFGAIEPYFDRSQYFGAIVGRYANRIAGARFTIDGKTRRLAKNSGPNSLHGGLKGFDKHFWTAELAGPGAIRFSRLSPDGEENYPGNLKVAVTYTLTARNELRISYRAQTDKPTVVNLSNHAYFNLAGAGNGSILGHRIKIHAGRYIPVDKNSMAMGEIRKVDRTPMDLRDWTVIGDNILAAGGNPPGFDHTYVLDRWPVRRPALAAEVWEPASGRMLQVQTEEPGVHFYTGNFLDGALKGKRGKVYRRYDGLCLETQHFPDSPNRPHFPSTILRPGEMYRSTTVFKFSAK